MTNKILYLQVKMSRIWCQVKGFAKLSCFIKFGYNFWMKWNNFCQLQFWSEPNMVPFFRGEGGSKIFGWGKHGLKRPSLPSWTGSTMMPLFKSRCPTELDVRGPPKCQNSAPLKTLDSIPICQRTIFGRRFILIPHPLAAPLWCPMS